MAVIKMTDVSLAHRLARVNLDLQPGEVLGLIGPNGAGKTSLLHCFAGVESYTGEIRLLDAALSDYSGEQRARLMGLLPQRCQSAWSLSVGDIIRLGRLPWRDDCPEKVSQAARMTGVNQWLDHPVDQLSGGEQARVWLARVLAGEPRVLLADEPLASLDLYYQCHILTLLRDYAQGERSVMLSMHDLSMAARYCDRLCLLHQGEVFALGSPAEVLTRENLLAVYQVQVQLDLAATPPVVSVIG
ncbi:Vitamin B12 ABC transporter, ATPase component BtuD [Nitrincola lacisaponensis]|uniref:Vitamin B12 ABC transporter, ATPase component BtuD n=1 Tax=Nitrincola lacisaponensis TaxID=267850 RepID=A0A063Y3A3_9GAMM|nr:ABC transporter ATP-binding protein [Nitrincola lacisaponensis]KDE40798.1 Vitamin B12 ABC transporter, ATPase component BtuD [Nitrincola lacisaponensis]